MQYKKIFLFALAVMLIGAPGCIIDTDGNFGCERGRDYFDTRELFLEDFHSVRVDGIANVYITQGPEQSVEVETHENLFNEIDRDVRGGEWSVGFDRCVRNVDRFDVFITIPEVRALTISGSGHITSENIIDGDELDLRISGSGDMDIGFDGQLIDSRISGSGDIRLEGSVALLDHQGTGSGDLEAFDMIATEADIDLTASGDAEVNVIEFLKVRISGSGDVLYKGNPELDISISGSGNVIDRN